MDVDVNPYFDGDDYVTDRDSVRLTSQLDKVRVYMEGADYLTVQQISADIQQPEPSVSAQIRNLRKDRFGARTVNREYRGDGCYAFKLEPKRIPMTYKIAPWSFSKIKAFEQCPKQFYHEKILKEYPFVQTTAMLYGNEFHKSAEDYIRDNVPLPKKFGYAQPVLDSLNAKRGVKYCEQKVGVTENLTTCGFYDKDVWFRGIIDLLIVDTLGETAWVIDYKTGKNARYADKGQLELMALSVFIHYPEVKKIKAGLVFVVSNDLIKAKYHEYDTSSLWTKWLGKYEAMKIAADKNVWNPRPNGLCKRHCPVTVCAHNGSN